jgi:hypothetical protein
VFVFAFLGMRVENGGREEEVREGQAFFCEIKRQLRSYIRESGWFYALCLVQDRFLFSRGLLLSNFISPSCPKLLAWLAPRK